MPEHSTTPNTPTSSPATEQGGKALLAGGLAALFASACCLGPLVLILVGVSGAWISHLTTLEPYQPLFMGVSLAALFFAARSIWRPTAACEPGQVCAIPRMLQTAVRCRGAAAHHRNGIPADSSLVLLMNAWL